MYAITEKERKINGTNITTFCRDIYSANVLGVEAGTNGYKGGDTGHGSRTYFRIENAGGTDIEARLIGPYGTDGIRSICFFDLTGIGRCDYVLWQDEYSD